MLKRCRHRGNTVCEEERGNSHFFRCQYHGWTYANTGDLIGVPIPSGYGPEFDKRDYGLARVARVGIHRGFVFASLAVDGMPLDEYLGPAREMIDMFCDLSPVGEVELRAGTHKSAFRGNWKFVGMDGYHRPKRWNDRARRPPRQSTRPRL
jgi:phenylpropionate dioxygenase-like ring-hydroxylating dioxygenase large terminal subunit